MLRPFWFHLTSLVVAFVLGAAVAPAFADDEQPAEAPQEAPAENAEGNATTEAAADAAGNQVKYEAGAETTEESKPAPTTAAAPEQPAAPEVDAREVGLSARIKALVKRLNTNDQRNLVYPSKPIEAALRTEFMRRTEGGTGAPWLSGRNAREADRSLALDNLDLFVTYAERLASLAAKPSKKKNLDKEMAEAKLLAVKWMIDRYNTAPKGERAPASQMFSPSEGLGVKGKTEWQRRKKLLGGLVAGTDYSAISVKNVDEYGKKYRAALSAAVAEYESMAELINESANRKPASSSGKKRRKK